MKRILTCLLTALWITATLALLTTAAAEPGKAGCPVSSEHDWKLEHEDAPTCDSTGTRYWHCDNCQKDTTETIPELDHDYLYETQAATCTETGYTRNRCTRCGNIFDQIDIPALGHDPEELPAKAATCTEPGLTKGSKCKRCGQILNEQTTIPAPGHDWDGGVVTTAVTCTTDGVKTYTCTRCGVTQTESIPATGHNAVAIPPVPATCTADGKTGGTKCSVCGEILIVPQDDPAWGHNWGGGVYTEPTCTEDGSRVFTCSRCGETRTDIFPATGHAWDSGKVITPSTCTTDGVLLFTCNSCGDTRTENFPATGHNLIPIPASAATCTKAGKTEGKLCTLCGTEVEKQQDIPALGHSWDGGTVTTAATCTTAGVKTYTCSRCGDDRTETIPATGHTAVTLPAVAATCTTGGKTEGSQCSVCGATLTAQTDIAALGHDWDEGVVTRKAGYLEEGEITYTCKRDASHTKKENIPVKGLPEGYSSVMSLMRNDPPGAGHAQKLAIFRQPEGGVIDGGFELSVEAMGGIEPYSYEWRIITGSANLEAFASGADPAASSLLSHRWRLAGKVSDRVTRRGATAFEAGKKLSSADFGFDSIPRDKTAVSYYDRSEICTPEFFIGARVGGDAPTITATSAGIYYCIVRDSAGDYVASEKVQVNDLLYIVQQPMNLNLLGWNSGTLICKADGGMSYADGSYMYMWCNEKGSDIKTGNENWIEVTEEGEYYCLVQDNYGTLITSDRATVYRANPLTVTPDEDVYYYLPGEEPVTIGMTVSGGVPPYEVRWTANFEMIDTFTTEETYLTKQVSDFAPYGFTVKDSMGSLVNTSCQVKYKQLRIAQQPEGGMLPANGDRLEISIKMAEGQAPFTFFLADIYSRVTDDPYCSFKVNKPGEYSYYISDANGRWAESDIVVVTDYRFRIDHIEKSGDLTAPDDTVTLTAILENDEEYVTYRWWWMGSMEAGVGGTELPDNGPVCIATRPGQYKCLATNRYGLDSTAIAWVDYLGGKPIILQQPESVILPYEEGKLLYTATLTVNAITSDSRTDVLEYRWEQKTSDGWQDAPGMGNNTYNWVEYLSEGKIKGSTFRCVVTDVRTGQKTISNEAITNTKMSCYHDGYATVYYGQPRVDIYGSGGSNSPSDRLRFLKFHIEGGTAPYVITVYQHRIEDAQCKDIIFVIFGISEDNGEVPVHIYYSYVSENSDYLKTPFAQYYIMVRDALGQVCYSDTH